MRLVIDGRRLGAERTGVGRFLEMLLTEWAKTGPPLAQTHVVLKDPVGANAIPEGSAVTSQVVGSPWPGMAWECWGLGRILEHDDLLFAPTNLVPPNWYGRTALVVFDTLQDVLPHTFSPWTRWRFGLRYRLAARRATRLIVPSQSTARDVARVYGVDRERIRVIPLAPDSRFRPLGDESPTVMRARQVAGVGSAPYFLFVGKRSRRRNVPAILEAFRTARRSLPEHRLLFVGPGQSGSASDSLRNEAGVILAGHVDDEALVGLMASATALLYPSEYEGFGLPVVEGLASGCPVITLRNSALTEAGGNAAIYLDRAEPQAIADAMIALVNNTEERARRITLGLEHAAGLSASKLAERVKEELAGLAADPRAGGPNVRRRAG